MFPVTLRRALFAVIAAAASAGAQSAPADSTSRWVDSIFAPYASNRAPGCAVGVTRDGALAFAKGYGMADLEHDTPITPDTRFYIASISKQFTAMSIVLLAQEHRLSLDDSIQKWVPEVPSFGATITLRHLLHHTSGLRDYFTLLAVSGLAERRPAHRAAVSLARASSEKSQLRARRRVSVQQHRLRAACRSS